MVINQPLIVPEIVTVVALTVMLAIGAVSCALIMAPVLNLLARLGSGFDIVSQGLGIRIAWRKAVIQAMCR